VLTEFGDTPIEAEKEEDLGSSSGWSRGSRPASPSRSRSCDAARGEGALTIAEAPKVESDEVESDAGFHAQEITEALSAHGTPRYAPAAPRVVRRERLAGAEAGLESGDVIRRVESRDIASLAELDATALAEVESQAALPDDRRGGEKRGSCWCAAAEPPAAPITAGQPSDQPTPP